MGKKGGATIVKQWMFFVLCIGACLFLTTCGLDTVFVLDEPTVTNNISYYDTDEPLRWYCDFVTEERKNDDIIGATFLGTEIYYKIYNNYASLSSQRSNIDLGNTATSNTAATRMIETYTYQPLNTSPDMKNALFVPSRGENQNVYLRLKTYKNSDGSIQYRAAIAFPRTEGDETYWCYDAQGKTVPYHYNSAANTWTDDEKKAVDYATLNFVVPYRTVSGADRSFDFFDDNDTNDSVNSEPVEGDIDYYYNTNGFTQGYEDTYFVQLYAVAVALDTNSCSNAYSLVLDLGCIPIAKDK